MPNAIKIWIDPKPGDLKKISIFLCKTLFGELQAGKLDWRWIVLNCNDGRQ